MFVCCVFYCLRFLLLIYFIVVNKMKNYYFESRIENVCEKTAVPFLAVYTNKINDELLSRLYSENDTYRYRENNGLNIVFQIHHSDILGKKRDMTFDFICSEYKWKQFARCCKRLHFNGTLCDNQFTAKHLECMDLLVDLRIGATNYSLFAGEDTSELPLCSVRFGGYGIVQRSEECKKWETKLNRNGCSFC